MGKIIAIANQKGGVGKTTSCVNLAASLHLTKQTALLIDMDPQGNATMGSGINKNNIPSFSNNDVLLEKCSINEAIIKSSGGYDLLPANSDLTEAEVLLSKLHNGIYRLKNIMVEFKTKYNFILIDCPPSLNTLTINALIAADSIFIPMQCEYYALEGLASLLKTIGDLKETVNPTLEIEGLLRTMYDGRNKLSIEVSNQLVSLFGDKVYKTIIPRNIKLAEAPSHGLPAMLYDSKSIGATAYLILAGEMLRAYNKTSLN